MRGVDILYRIGVDFPDIREVLNSQIGTVEIYQLY